MRSSARSRDDDDVIRARLRVLLAETQRTHGWVPEDEGDPFSSGASDAEADDEADDEVDGGEDDGHGDLPGPPPADDVALPFGLGRHRVPGRTARLDPGRPGAWALWVVAVLAAAAVIGWTWLDRPAVNQVPLASATTATAATAPTSAPTPTAHATAGPSTALAVPAGTVVVSVVGQVAAPGLVTLPAGSRVADALTAVGGLLPEADPGSINAAAVLSDGQQIAVGVPGAAAQPTSGGPASGGGSGAGAGGPLNLNTATVADLDALPGIGPVLAQRIVDHRTAHGPFTSVDQLDEVSGIGPAIFTDLVGRVRV